jgi:hypothetical protein
MVGGTIQIRGVALNAVSALLLGCLFVPIAHARQESSAETPAKSSSKTNSSGAASSKRSSSSQNTAAAVPATKKSTHTGTATTSRTASSGKRSPSRKKSTRARGQQKIDPERAQAIQAALIREHYLSADTTGPWNQASENAMRRYQEDHGWQTKEVPDSRALIKLGLGPSKDGLLNPESAMTTVPDAPKSESVPANSPIPEPAPSQRSPNPQ